MNQIALVAAVIISLIIGGIIRRCLINSMSNLHVAQAATDYLQRDSINITTEIDTYLFTNLSVIPKSKDDNQDDNNDSDNDFDDDSDNDSDNDFDNDSGSDSDSGSDN